MNIFEVILLNIILMTFPLLLYLFYVAHNKNINKKVNNLIFDFSLLTSLYLTTQISYINLNTTLLMTSVIPLSIAYMRKDRLSIFLLSLFSVVSYYYLFNFNIIILCLEYLLYYIIYMLFRRKKVKPFNIIILIKIFIITISLWETNFYFRKSQFEIFLQVLIPLVVSYIIFKFIIILLEKGEEILTYHISIKDIEKEKQVRNSLFKIAHEIKNPMAVCKGYFDMMDMDNVNQTKKYLPIIKEEINHTLIILQDFLSITKVKVEKDMMDINMLVEEVSDSFKPILESNNIDKKIELLDDEIYISGDYNRLKQVLINIIKNSIESINREDGIITIQTKKENNMFEIMISDNGIGIDEENMKHISEPFFTTKKNGTGLGIALSKEILNAHNAKIQYESKLNIGTKVLISVPI